MLNSYFIQAPISQEVLISALKSSFPDFIIQNTLTSIAAQQNHIYIKECSESKEIEFHTLLESKSREIQELESASNNALVSIQTFQQQQQALFEEFVVLRQKYDDQKSSLVNILWGPCSKYHPELLHIPEIEDPNLFTETDTQVGKYSVGHILGEGQFATVMVCFDSNENEYALKIINKDRITAFNALKRVSNEIDILKRLKSPYIVSILDAIQTQSKLYLVTEKGGSDLFEFFDEHPTGVPEAWAKQIIGNLLKAVLYCHDLGICHRDIKPENLLLQFDSVRGQCIDLKLCDFGLSSEFKPRTYLSDFCGSPGFFAPEMILHGSYYGDKADIWSIGCVLLELILGHEKFTDLWMVAYDYEVLRDKSVFASEIKAAVGRLPEALRGWPQVKDFALQLLKFRSTDRPNVKNACLHEWVVETMGDVMSQLKPSPSNKLLSPMKKMTINTNDLTFTSPPSMGSLSPRSRGQSMDIPDHLTLQIPSNLSPVFGSTPNTFTPHSDQNTVDQEILKTVAASNKERKLHDDIAAAKASGLSLPPIEPGTPSIVHARKMLCQTDSQTGQLLPPKQSFSSPSGKKSLSAAAAASTSSISPSPGGRYQQYQKYHQQSGNNNAGRAPFGGSLEEDWESEHNQNQHMTPMDLPSSYNININHESQWSHERKSTGSTNCTPLENNTELGRGLLSSSSSSNVCSSDPNTLPPSHNNNNHPTTNSKIRLLTTDSVPLVSQSLPSSFHDLSSSSSSPTPHLTSPVPLSRSSRGSRSNLLRPLTPTPNSSQSQSQSTSFPAPTTPRRKNSLHSQS